MVLRCSKTGRIFFTTEEATEHAEAFGKEYANFEEVSLDAPVWICVENGRPCYSEVEIERLRRRDPSSQTFEKKTVKDLMELQKLKASQKDRQYKFLQSVDQKKLEVLTMIKKHGTNRSAKALYFTKGGNLEAAEKWLSEHAEDADLDQLTDAFLDSAVVESGAGSGGDGDVVMTDASPPEERKLGDPNPPEVKEKVNQELLTQMTEMGFSELRAEKALFKTDNAGIEHAVRWLTEHEGDEDIDLPLAKPAPPPPEKPKMSKEEAEAKAIELQKKLREKKAQEEKLSEKEKERMRIESTKMMVEANEKLKEEEKKRAFEQIQREKDEHERHRKELKERLRQDYIDRFGKEPPPEEEQQAEVVKEKSAKDQVVFFLNKLKKGYKDSNPEGFKTCLSTLKVYTKNLMDNPQEIKFKKLKLDNKAFQTRIMPYDGAIELLDVLGFEKKEDCLEQRKSIPDGWLCGNAIKFIDLMLSQ